MTEAVLFRALARARKRLAAGDLPAARSEAEAIVASGARDEERGAAHLVLAACCEKAGDAAAALEHVRSALALAPGEPLAHYAYAERLEAAGNSRGAIASLKRALELEPRFAQALRYLGILLGESGDEAAAIAAFEQALAVDPNHERAWNNLGNAQRSLGRLAEAERSFARALELLPDYALAAANLAEAQRDQGDTERAEATLRAALARSTQGKPFRPVVVLLASLLRARGALDEAESLYRQAIDLAPEESAGQWVSLAWVLGERGETAAAQKAYVTARMVDRTDLRGLLGEHLTLPMIHSGVNDLAAARASFASGLGALERELPAAAAGLAPERLLDGFRWTNFFLAYQGQDDRALQEAYASLVARTVEQGAPEWRTALDPKPSAGRRLRVGFASAFFHVGTCGRYFRSWITDLDRDRFEVFVYHLYPGMDEVANAIAQRADRLRCFAGMRSRPSIVAPVIRADELDVLVYPELGMDACSFALAALRLAPRQYAGWGHPVTTGHATIDAFLTSGAMEPEGAEAHYTETLIRLPGIGTRYQRLNVPRDATRARFGLPEEPALLLCPQSVWKIHPDNDALFAELLAANPRTKLVLFEGRLAAVGAQFLRRLERVFAEHGLALHERVRVLPHMDHDDYLRVNVVCDAMLDTLHWSGGNTSLDALACTLPIVTLPGRFMRGRQSAGMLGLLGVPELIARDRAEYLAIAARLAADRAWRSQLRARIGAQEECLFEASDPIVSLQAFLQAGTLTA